MSFVVVPVVLLFTPRGIVPWVRDKIETACPLCKARNGVWRGQICCSPPGKE